MIQPFFVGTFDKKTIAMANAIPLKKRRILAESYYFNFYTQKEIAELLDTPENTISRWVNQGDWKKIRDMKAVTRDKMVSELMGQINHMQTSAKEENRPLSTKECDAIMKLSSSIEKLDKKINLPVIIQVLKDFNEYLLRNDLDLAKKLLAHQNNFIRNHAE